MPEKIHLDVSSLRVCAWTVALLESEVQRLFQSKANVFIQFPMTMGDVVELLEAWTCNLEVSASSLLSLWPLA